MKATIIALGLVLGAFVAAPPAQAQMPPCCPSIPVGPPPFCWYEQNLYGQWFGPNCYPFPPYPPFQGMVTPPKQSQLMAQWQVAQQWQQLQRQQWPQSPQLQQMQQFSQQQGSCPQVAFPTHPYARSPRDFFMWEK